MPKPLSKTELQARLRAKRLPTNGNCAALRKRLGMKPIRSGGGCDSQVTTSASTNTKTKTTRMPLSKTELQARLRAKGLSVDGNCATLRKRLGMKPVTVRSGAGCDAPTTPIKRKPLPPLPAKPPKIHKPLPPPPSRNRKTPPKETPSKQSDSIHVYEILSSTSPEPVASKPVLPIRYVVDKSKLLTVMLNNDGKKKTFKFNLNCLGNELRLEEKIGAGAFGAAFIACTVRGCDRVLKIVPLGSGFTSKKRFAQEAEMTLAMSTAGIGAKLYNSFICTTSGELSVGVLVLERWDGDMNKDDIEQVAQSIPLQDILASHIEKLHDLGYVHYDVQPKNVLVRRAGKKVIDLRLTDWGLTEKRDTLLQKSWLKKLYKYHANDNHYTSLGLREITFEQVVSNPELLDAGLLFYFFYRRRAIAKK